MKKLVVHLPRRITAPQALDLRRLSDAASEASEASGRSGRRKNSEASEVSEVSEERPFLVKFSGNSIENLRLIKD